MRSFLRDLPFRPGLIALAVIGAGLGYGVWQLGGRRYLLDTALSGSQACRIIGCLSAEQRNTHFWMTLTLDCVFPAAYGLILLQVVAKASGPTALLVLPFLAVGFDYVENFSQLLALTGNDSCLWMKSIVSPAKFAAIGAIVIWRLFPRSTGPGSAIRK